MTGQRMRIGAFSKATGISVDAVRFYERRRVLRPAPRTHGGYRTFDDDDVERVMLARHLQHLGLSIDEVADALGAHDTEGATCGTQRWRLEQVEARVEAQLTALRRTRHLIREAIAACASGECHLVRRHDAEPQA
jgi:DNA-binding transcriptional MerR regulator